MMRYRILFCAFFAALLYAGLSDCAYAQASGEKKSLFELSFDELMEVKVISVSRDPDQPLFTSPAAVYVITDEDIRRSGHLGLPEQLRMVPGLHVAQIDANKWAISCRGDNQRFSRQLLVQMDGRTLYSPVFAGTYWEVQDTVIENIDRIEVVRGPGGTLWESSAVNGVINVVTKPASQTQGWLFSGGIGSEERGFGTVQYGGRAGENTYYRFYAKHREQDESDVYGADYTDDRGLSQLGFRLDSQPDTHQNLTLQGDYYKARVSDSQQTIDLDHGTNGVASYDNIFEGVNILGRWNRSFSADSEMQLQLYGDWNWLHDDDPDVGVRLAVGTYDFDFQHHLHLGARHTLIWGLGYRLVTFNYRNTPKVIFDPTYRRESTFTSFVQDEIALIADRLNLTLGTKIEHNEYTGFEFDPTARLGWTPHENHFIWAAVSRAVKPAAMLHNYATINLAAVGRNTAVSVAPRRDKYLSITNAFEVGYRAKFMRRLSVDIATFFNDIDRRQYGKQVSVSPPTLQWDDRQKGKSYGVEAAINWQVTQRWRLLGGYTWFHYNLYHAGDQGPEEDSPKHQAQVRSYFDISPGLEFNTALYYYDAVPNQHIPPYIRLDIGLTWRPAKNLEISLWGQNLLDDKHPEFRQDEYVAAGAGEIQRSCYTKITWRY